MSSSRARSRSSLLSSIVIPEEFSDLEIGSSSGSSSDEMSPVPFIPPESVLLLSSKDANFRMLKRIYAVKIWLLWRAGHDYKLLQRIDTMKALSSRLAVVFCDRSICSNPDDEKSVYARLPPWNALLKFFWKRTDIDDTRVEAGIMGLPFVLHGRFLSKKVLDPVDGLQWCDIVPEAVHGRSMSSLFSCLIVQAEQVRDSSFSHMSKFCDHVDVFSDITEAIEVLGMPLNKTRLIMCDVDLLEGENGRSLMAFGKPVVGILNVPPSLVFDHTISDRALNMGASVVLTAPFKEAYYPFLYALMQKPSLSQYAFYLEYYANLIFGRR